MGLRSNNNKEVVKLLAISSIKNSRRRNLFIIITIALSVSLLMVISLFTIGFEESLKRQVADMQHVIYHKVTEEQIKALAKDDRVEILKLDKFGQGIEVDNKMIQPVWYGKEAIKGNGLDIATASIKTGKLPEGMNEIAVSEGYCETIGKPAKPGTVISLTFLDEITEEFVISGILDMTDKTKIYPILFSESYAKEGTQLKDIMYDALVRIHHAEKMSQSELIAEIYDVAVKSGMERTQVNENNYFLNTLSGGPRQPQQNITIVVIGIGILFVSVLVIYSVFYLSVVGRIKQFGQLRTIGMTKKQIRRMITKEGLLLSVIGIPIGLFIGGTIAYLLQMNGWNWKNTLVISAIVIITDLVSVLISIKKPAKIASMISPIEAANYSGYQEKNGKSVTKQLQRNLTPLNLAKMSTIRNRKKTIITTISLGVGGILFMIATTFISSTSLEEYSRQGGFRFGEFIIDLSYNAAETTEHGVTDLQINNSLNDVLINRIKAVDGVKNVTPYAQAAMRWEAHGVMEEDYITGFSKGEISDKYLEAGTLDYNKMIKNNEILICGNNSLFEDTYGWKYKLGDKIVISFFNGTEEVKKEFTVVGFIKDEYVTKNPVVGCYLMPKDALNEIMKNMNLTIELIISTEALKQEHVEKELRKIVEKNPLLTMDTLRENEEIDKANFVVIFGMILGLSIFIIGFSMINLVNTLITNVVTRKQEFAMLQSIGMTSKQLMKMIQAEGVLLSLGNLFITVIVGTPLSYVVVKLLRYFGAFYMHFTYPTWFFLVYVVLILIVPVVVSAISIHNFNKQTLVERLRIED